MQRWNHGFSSPLWQALEMIETTMVETSPSRMCISGPCFLAKSLNARWGREPIKWCMLPMIGSFDGPGVDLKLLSFQDHHEEQEGDQQDWEG
jgi:hypothetical protein